MDTMPSPDSDFVLIPGNPPPQGAEIVWFKITGGGSGTMHKAVSPPDKEYEA